jgi:tRNA-specific 2-thiouridylase
MSGGLDSSVAALLLKENGLEVRGVTCRFVGHEGEKASEGSRDCAVERARQVCSRLDIPHHVLDRTQPFERLVIDPFCAEYAAGRTPNPCVRCNAFLKWPTLLEAASALGCSYVATGHYARLRNEGGRFQILRGTDRGKDQSYALYALPQAALAKTLLPLGFMTKEAVRRIAERASLPVSGIRESQDVCFIPQGDYRGFLSPRLPVSPGPIQDMRGRVLGTHRGLPFYTVGQRKGLGVAAGRAVYVIEKDIEKNLLVVGPREALCTRTFPVAGVNWVSAACPPAETVLDADVEVRYRTQVVPGRIRVLGPDTVRIDLSEHDQAVAPGQSAVWYREDVLLGGGIIQEAGTSSRSP